MFKEKIRFLFKIAYVGYENEVLQMYDSTPQIFSLSAITNFPSTVILDHVVCFPEFIMKEKTSFIFHRDGHQGSITEANKLSYHVVAVTYPPLLEMRSKTRHM